MAIYITYDLKKDSYNIVSGYKKDYLPELISECLRAQIGAGKDERAPNERNVYNITVDLNLEQDVFKISSDTGNKSLTAGILMQLVSYFKENPDKITYGN